MVDDRWPSVIPHKPEHESPPWSQGVAGSAHLAWGPGSLPPCLHFPQYKGTWTRSGLLSATIRTAEIGHSREEFGKRRLCPWETGGQAAVTTSRVRGLSRPPSVSFRRGGQEEGRSRGQASCTRQVSPQCWQGPVGLWPRGSRHSRIPVRVRESGLASLFPPSQGSPVFYSRGSSTLVPSTPGAKIIFTCRLSLPAPPQLPQLRAAEGLLPPGTGSKPRSGALAEWATLLGSCC